jgi:hypothetical protein
VSTRQNKGQVSTATDIDHGDNPRKEQRMFQLATDALCDCQKLVLGCSCAYFLGGSPLQRLQLQLHLQHVVPAARQVKRLLPVLQLWAGVAELEPATVIHVD